MQVILSQNSIQTDITGFVTSLTLSGDYKSCCRECSFGVIQNQSVKELPVLNIKLGDLITVMHNNLTLFSGFVWNKTKDAQGSVIDFLAKDRGIYLNKNQAYYNFKNILPQDITKKICADYGITVGSVAQVDTPISRIFMGDTLYKIIISSYNLAKTDKKYMVIFTGHKLNVIEKGTVRALDLQTGANLINANVSQSIDNMVNTIKVYNGENSLINTYKNDEDIKNFGSLGSIIKASSKDTDYEKLAKDTLKSVDQRIRVQNFGDVGLTTGKYVVVSEPVTGLKGKFYIESDKHNFNNGIYTNELVLNFENLSDESEGGSDG